MGKAAGLYSQDKNPETGLTARQQAVYDGLTGKEGAIKTQMQIAAEIGISRQRVRQIVTDLLKRGFEIPGVRAPQEPKPESETVAPE